mmetsp:Transcript_36796/g.99563  ORF Transcript_36796/g.99563 Transcript_36796/m.99563 type:complete len:201 (-) Transcript_36796:334-936(-)
MGLDALRQLRHEEGAVRVDMLEAHSPHRQLFESPGKVLEQALVDVPECLRKGNEARRRSLHPPSLAQARHKELLISSLLGQRVPVRLEHRLSFVLLEAPLAPARGSLLKAIHRPVVDVPREGALGVLSQERQEVEARRLHEGCWSSPVAQPTAIHQRVRRIVVLEMGGARDPGGPDFFLALYSHWQMRHLLHAGVNQGLT